MKAKTVRKTRGARRIDAGSRERPLVTRRLLALHAATDSQSFIKAATRLLAAAVPHDVTYVMLHYFTGFGRLTETWASDGSTWTEEWLRGHHATNPAHRVLSAAPGRKVMTLRSCYASDKEMVESRFYREYMQPLHTQHAAALMFWNHAKNGVDCGIGLHRKPGQPEFTALELEALERIHPHIETAFRRVSKLQSEAGARDSLQQFLRGLPLPTVLLNWELDPVYHNAAAAEDALAWAGGSLNLKRARSFSVPPDLLAELQSMRQTWTTAMQTEPASAPFLRRELRHPKIAGLRAILSMTTLRSPHMGNPSFLLRFERAGVAKGEKLNSLSQLSVRERELALLICEGQSNQEIADSLGKSLATVKSELHSVFKKLEVESRGKLMALLC